MIKKRKNKHLEDDLQIAVANYLDNINMLWCHVANERKTSLQSGKILKKKGVKPGVPDCLIFTPNKKYNGLAIELKSEKKVFNKQGKQLTSIKGKTTYDQLKWLCDLSACGWYTCVCYNFDEVFETIKLYVKNKL